MDVIALVRAEFCRTPLRRWAPLSTEDQLQMLWRAAPEPVALRAFDGDNAGQNAPAEPPIHGAACT